MRALPRSSGRRRELTPIYRYYGGPGAAYVEEILRFVIFRKAEDPAAAYDVFRTFLLTIPPDIAKRAFDAMERVQADERAMAVVQPLLADGVIDEYEAQQIIQRYICSRRIEEGLLAISEWVHDVLFRYGIRLTEVEVPEEGGEEEW